MVVACKTHSYSAGIIQHHKHEEEMLPYSTLPKLVGNRVSRVSPDV